MVRYWALVLAGLAVAASTTAHGDTGSLAGKIQVTVSLPRAEYLLGEKIPTYVCFADISNQTLTFERPGGTTPDDLVGPDIRLFDSQENEIPHSGGYPLFMTSLEDLLPLELYPGEEYWLYYQDPELNAHTAHYQPGQYGMAVRFYYYDDDMPDYAGTGDVESLERQWREAHYKYLDSNMVWFVRLNEQAKAKQPRLSVNNAEVAEARPLCFDGVLYADSGGLAQVGVRVDIDGEKVVARRGEREVTLTLGKWNPKRDAQRPALPSGGAIYLPLRQVATALGLRVNWDPATQTADVRS